MRIWIAIGTIWCTTSWFHSAVKAVEGSVVSEVKFLLEISIMIVCDGRFVGVGRCIVCEFVTGS